LKIECW